MTYDEVLQRLYPEIAAGGYGRQDLVVEFYGRVQSLLRPRDTVLDLGAGRGRFHDNPSAYRRKLTDLGGEDRTVVAVDPDPVVLDNRTADQVLVMPDPEKIPVDSHSCDLIVANWVFEHVANPSALAPDIDRVLRPGGWLCAQTTNKWGYIGLGARIVPNLAHGPILKRLQPDRQSRDIFPTRYRMNTPGTLRSFFPGYLHIVYGYQGPPLYVGTSLAVNRLAKSLLNTLPSSCAAALLVFFQKPE
jgi:SAM-dependent methyltransferase